MDFLKGIDEAIEFYIKNKGYAPKEILLTLDNFNKIKPFIEADKKYPTGTYRGVKINVGIEMKW